MFGGAVDSSNARAAARKEQACHLYGCTELDVAW